MYIYIYIYCLALYIVRLLVELSLFRGRSMTYLVSESSSSDTNLESYL